MRRLILAAFLAAPTGCIVILPAAEVEPPIAATPVLYPLDPPPNIADGQELMVIPQDLVDVLADEETIHLREATLQAVTEGRRVFTAPGRAEAIKAHRIVTGMTVEEVVLSVSAPPTAVRSQGPPGGDTLLWEPKGFRASERFWVRFNKWGQVSAAGLH